MKVRKKPVEVEAWQNSDDTGWPEWMNSADIGRGYGGSIFINTLEGVMKAEPGDWIIKGVRGEFYPVKPDIFAETYEVIEP